MIRDVSIFLKSKTPAFSLSKDNISLFKNLFPSLKLTICETKNEFLDSLKNCNAAITWVFKEEWYDLTNSLKIVATPAAGSDWIEDDPKQIVKIYHGSFHGIVMSESIIGAILFLNRLIFKTISKSQNREWDRDFLSATKPLSEQSIAIAGYGSIGKILAKKLSALTPNIYGLKQSKTGYIDEYGTSIINYEEFIKIISTVDHVIDILPDTENTKNFFSENIFKKMKKEACFYNFGRGTTVNEEDLITALKSKFIRASLLDVVKKEPLPIDSPLWSVDNLFITHHSSAVYYNYIELYFRELKELNILSGDNL